MNLFLKIMIMSALLFCTSNFCTASTEIRGRVVDKDTGRPIFAAAVKVESEGRILEQTRTDKDGVFHLSQDAVGENHTGICPTKLFERRSGRRYAA